MAITLSPSGILPAAPPASRSADPTAETTDNGFAALFALVAMPTLVDAPPAPETGTGVGEAPDDTATPAVAVRNGFRAAAAATWEATLDGGPPPSEAPPPPAPPTPTHLLTDEMVQDESTAPAAPPPNNAPPAAEPAAITAIDPTLRGAPVAPPSHAAAALTPTDPASPTTPLPTGEPSHATPMATDEASYAAPPPPFDPAAMAFVATAATATLATAALSALRTDGPGEPTGRDPHEKSAAPSAAITTEAAAARSDAPTAAPPAAAILPSRIAAVVADHIRQSGPGRHRLEITLHPPELGRVEVHMVVGHDTVHAHLMAQNEAGRDALAHHLPALREQLAAHGFTDAQVDVDLSGRGGEQRSHRQPAFADHPAPAAAKETAVATPHRPPAVRRLLDRRA